jgi:hypothetical protein
VAPPVKLSKVAKKPSALIAKQQEISDIEDVDANLPADVGEHIKFIKKMRSELEAPVDSMGCHTLADPTADVKVFFF